MSDKILIVDDDIDSLKLIGLMLQRHGYEVVAANAGNQALAKATSEHPNLIILDVMMPDMDGWEVYQQMKADDSMRNIPVIVVTAKAQNIDKVLGLHIAKVDDYIAKPFGPQELMDSVEKILGKKSSS